MTLSAHSQDICSAVSSHAHFVVMSWTRAEVEDPVQPSNSPLPPTDLQASDPAPAPVDDDYAGPSDASIVATAGSDQPAVAVSEVM